jgi:hypothetical protein
LHPPPRSGEDEEARGVFANKATESFGDIAMTASPEGPMTAPRRKQRSSRRSKQQWRARARKAGGKKPTGKDFQKRRTVGEGLQLVDDAHAAVWRLYCEVLGNWGSCRLGRCRRHRRCAGEPARCLDRVLPTVTPEQRLYAEKEVIAGGPRRLPASTHMEYVVRRQPLNVLTTWRAPKARSG